MIEKFLELGMKKIAEQLVNCLDSKLNFLKHIPHLRMILQAKIFRYQLEILKLTNRSSTIPICERNGYLQRFQRCNVLRLFREFLEYEANKRNQESNSIPWTSTDNTLVADFINLIREEVGHACKECATRQSDNFVNSFLNSVPSNYLLPGIDLLMFAGFNPNKKIDKFGDTVLHSILKRRLAFFDSAVPVAKLLIEKGFHFNQTNNRGETVLDLAKNFPNSALYRYLNQTMNPLMSNQSLKFLSAQAVSQADFDLVTRSNCTAIPIQLIDLIKCKGKVKVA
jgi:hypothetical protein